MNFIYITQNGYAALVTHDTGSSLTALQTLLGGYVDCMSSDREVMEFDADIWVNDEFLFQKDFGVNYPASKMAGCYYVNPIFGPAVITKVDNEGNTCGLSDKEIEILKRKLPLYGTTEIDTNDGKGWTVEQAAYFFGPEVATV